ncbi:sensor domain-containing diguanylate cyclase [Duganella sp. BJB488]|uniref:sensor domain-containing diguanylate cyclase n=1 Tax=unclassified Duganella TaxID=2636909 RepID=UPI000E344183|nr:MULTISPECIES: sensor domain-containing diguanylate cyclase [unclassified Duganella]RFP09141.1 sensor domain-containing diguanylate cyclase [Duganella sp. BJB489]RFP12572.1 sensor domain-containing diguanylate cyclase [Duganella sp. BJB488]RFP29138.1 sensor domain-containing diguanylate cyclase [Duganella sp. BJB480]
MQAKPIATPPAAGSHTHLSARVLGLANLGLMVLDADGRIVMWNQWLASHSGLSAQRVQGSDLFDLFPELRGQRLEQAVQSAMQSKLPQQLSPALNRSPFPLYPAGTWGGERVEQAVSVTPFTEGKERFCLIEVSDISTTVGRERQLRGQAEALRAQSYVDGLTGIANRRHFDVALDRELRRAQRNNSQLSLLLMDIDSFKAYNDHFGHQQGDACLTLVAEAFAAMLQRPADLAARYGGEEFAAVLPDTGPEQAAQHAEAIRARIAALEITHAPAATRPHVTMSIGVASYDKHGLCDAATMLAAADSCLYAAKHAGRDCVIVHKPAEQAA